MRPVILLLLIVITFTGISCKRIDTSDPDKMLIVASQLGDIDRVRLAIAKGADINARDENGGTALHWAVFYEYGDIVKLLLMHGADPYIKDKNGITPVDVARINKKVRMLKILEKYIKEKK
ncbi:MAG: ankyrin repeat domain-containing protein [Aquificae bacterium]|nr:ankyrin repeat domain-containing protein [Aquificota bacterium]